MWPKTCFCPWGGVCAPRARFIRCTLRALVVFLGGLSVAIKQFGWVRRRTIDGQALFSKQRAFAGRAGRADSKSRSIEAASLPWKLNVKGGIAFFGALANNAASSGEASSAKDCGGWTAHGSRSRVDGDPDSG